MHFPVFLRRALCVLLALLLCAAPGARCESEPRWRAGFGQREIPLPENAGPLYIAGYRNGYEITGVLDLPRATAVWLDCGGAGVLLIGVDCVGLSRAYVEQLRASLAVECREWNCAQVNVYATHTHAGVDTMGLWGKVGRDGKNEAFMQNLLQAARSAALDAYADRRAGTLSYGKAATAGMQRDSRLPYEYDPHIHHLKFAPDDGGAGFLIILKWNVPGELFGGIPAHAGDQDGFLSVLPEPVSDKIDLFRRFSGAVDDLADSLAQAAVAVQTRDADVVEWFLFQFQKRVIYAGGSVCNLPQQSSYFIFIHRFSLLIPP